VGVLGGIALAEAQSVFLSLGPRHAAALGRPNRLIRLTSDQVAEANARQLTGGCNRYCGPEMSERLLSLQISNCAALPACGLVAGNEGAD
jgi:hypothetical protein